VILLITSNDTPLRRSHPGLASRRYRIARFATLVVPRWSLAHPAGALGAGVGGVAVHGGIWLVLKRLSVQESRVVLALGVGDRLRFPIASWRVRVSELLDRIQREIRERLEASRAAVREHERLEAALHALGDAGSRATRAVTGRGDGARASSRSARPSSSSRKPAGAAARSSKRAAPGGVKRAATADGESGATASARRRSGAAAGGRGQRTSRGGTAPATDAKKTGAGRATGGAAPARKRAAPGANREAVLRVIGERPGVTPRELAAASQVTGGTLYTLLRRLAQEGTLEKRELPGGQTGYTIAAGATSGAQAAPTDRAATSIEPGVGARPGARSEGRQGGASNGGQATRTPNDGS
jgi:hypothetical protein